MWLWWKGNTKAREWQEGQENICRSQVRDKKGSEPEAESGEAGRDRSFIVARSAKILEY